MSKIMYVAYDCKSESYTPPMLHLARGDAIRSFTQAVNDKSTLVGLNPEDFTLFEVGTYDERTGEFKIYDAPEHVANAWELVTSDQSEKPQAA
jgi:hypothetical protein